MKLTTIARPRVEQKAAKLMMDSLPASHKNGGGYLHYDHSDACKFSRWTARESYQFMYAKPWQKIVDFYSNLVNGHISLSGIFGTEPRFIHDEVDILEASDKSELVSFPTSKRTGRWARVTFKIVLSYDGGSFDGWQKQPGLNTVQGVVESSLGKFIDEKKLRLLKDKGLPIEGCAVVAGRTDKRVTAFRQVCSFYTWRTDVKAQDIEKAINDTAPGKLRVVSVSEVSRAFHPNFSAKWRRYLYILPLHSGDEGEEDVENTDYNNVKEDIVVEDSELLKDNDEENFEMESKKKSIRFRVDKVNRLLLQLEGKLLSYKMFARDTKASRSSGPPTECFLFHARATETTLPSSIGDDDAKEGEGGGTTKAMCIELVGNRFLRKMVRVLVATAIREAAAGAEDDALIKLMDATCRRATAPPAPPDGLCLVDVGYTDFDPKICLIL